MGKNFKKQTIFQCHVKKPQSLNQLGSLLIINSQKEMSAFLDITFFHINLSILIFGLKLGTDEQSIK
ncbi:hypothetical protein BpHYR1_022154 [Brachionus plicatilis]|uniref:Uncharacterized protein n=1 Tax=Brachionus plicatilis TaxID=10195 RepID=A0A3M7SKP8_BRAPC|nr:hypothetical protein BpHYR1_022154 [Brachionus plicatilis]